MFDDEVNAYDQADRTSPPPLNPIVFYGSPRILSCDHGVLRVVRPSAHLTEKKFLYYRWAK